MDTGVTPRNVPIQKGTGERKPTKMIEQLRRENRNTVASYHLYYTPYVVTVCSALASYYYIIEP